MVKIFADTGKTCLTGRPAPVFLARRVKIIWNKPTSSDSTNYVILVDSICMYVHTYVLELQKMCAILLKLVRKALSHFWNGHLLVKKVNPFPALTLQSKFNKPLR